MKHRKNMAGSYWRLALSSDWSGGVFWSFEGVAQPYIGIGGDKKVVMYLLGPIALIRVIIPESVNHV